MSATAEITVSVSQATYERLKQRAEEEKCSIAEVLEEDLELGEKRSEAFRRMGEAIARSQAAAILNGTSEMTMEQINEEIDAARREAAELRRPA
jgi:predicted CopG family antitoxin